ncbi:MAG: hypothetical protein ACRD0Z_01695 [Acidimicrobiales bacterium]
MTDDSSFESSVRARLAAEARSYSEPDNIPARLERAVARRTRVRYLRRAGVVALAVVVTAAAVVVPNEIRRTDTVLAALSSVFSSPSVQFSITASGPGAPSGGALVVTLTNPSGGPVSQAASTDNVEVSVLRGGVDQADLVVADDEAYARLNVPALAAQRSYYSDLIAPFGLVAEQNSDLSALKLVDQSDWVAVTEASIDSYVQSRHEKAPAPASVGQLRSSFALSFAQAWDAWTSMRQVSAPNGATEYSVSLPSEKFLGSLLSDLQGPLVAALPAARSWVDDLLGSISGISPSQTVAMSMWVSSGVMTRLQVRQPNGPDSLTIGVSHPTSGVTAPQPAATTSMQSLASIENLVGLGGGGSVAGCHETEGNDTLSCSAPPLQCMRLLIGGQGCSNKELAPPALAQFDLENAVLVVEQLAADGSIGGNQSRQATANYLENQSQHAYLGIGGLFYTAGISTVENTISVAFGNHGTYNVLAAWDTVGTCWGVLEVTAPQPSAVLGISRRIGTYYFEAVHSNSGQLGTIPTTGASACNAGTLKSVTEWSDQGFPTTTSTALPPLPVATFGTGGSLVWTGRDPTTIYISGDAQNIVIGITWSSWGPTEALGHGTSNILGCVPSCAMGSATPVPTTIVLSHPVQGRFTLLTETRQGSTTTYPLPVEVGGAS